MSKTLKMPNRSDLCEIYERTERIAHFPAKVDILASRTPGQLSAKIKEQIGQLCK